VLVSSAIFKEEDESASILFNSSTSLADSQEVSLFKMRPIARALDYNSKQLARSSSLEAAGRAPRSEVVSEMFTPL